METYERSIENLRITQSEEYKQYMKALCKLASGYVSRIRVQFAEKAFDKFQDATTRRIVIEYGKEAEKLEADRLRDFRHVSEFGATTPEHLNDSCLNRASDYQHTAFMLFDIE